MNGGAADFPLLLEENGEKTGLKDGKIRRQQMPTLRGTQSGFTF